MYNKDSYLILGFRENVSKEMTLNWDLSSKQELAGWKQHRGTIKWASFQAMGQHV